MQSRKFTGDILCVLLILAGEILFFHNILFNDSLIGYRIDGRLVTFLTEHWYEVFQGRELWTELPCFYPADHVLAYSDMMLLFAFPYCLLRILGSDMYTALKMTAIFFHVLGSCQLYYFMRKYVKTPNVVSLFTVICFSFSNGYNFISGNIQMFTLSLLPMLLILFGFYMKNLKSRRRHIAAIACVVWLSLLFYTAFYVGYFVCLFLGIMILTGLVSYVIFCKQPWMRERSKNFFQHWKEHICYLLLFVLLMLPFVYIYLPALKSFGGREWEDVLTMFPTWRNICMLNEKSEDLAGFNPEIYNYKTGFPLIDLAIYGLLGIWLFRVLVKKIKEDRFQIKDYLLFWGLLTVVISFLLIIKVKGITLWWLVYHFIPGASAIRAVIRWLNFISLPMAILFGGMMAYLIKGKKQWMQYLIVAGISSILFCSNYCVTGIASGWSVSEELSFEENVASPPDDCKILCVVDLGKTTNVASQELQMDAWAIALKYHLKTVNGYSGQQPEGWNIQNLQDADVGREVWKWLEINHRSVKGVYLYDIGMDKWEKLEDELR